MMEWFKETIDLSTQGKGLYPFTDKINKLISRWRVAEGMCYLFLKHTSASLVISESYDPTAKKDLEAFMERLVPEGQSWYQHDLEGPDDATSHIRAMLTLTSLTIPVDGGQLSLGTWQGVYLFEHRARSHNRKVMVRCLKIG
jgi:secondary thiamine-phosphate synthase enzyme